MFELMFNIRDGVSSPLEVVNEMSRFNDIHIYAEHYYEFEPLFIDLYNHTRNPHLNGYTPEEYLQMTNDSEESMYAVKETTRVRAEAGKSIKNAAEPICRLENNILRFCFLLC